MVVTFELYHPKNKLQQHYRPFSHCRNFYNSILSPGILKNLGALLPLSGEKKKSSLKPKLSLRKVPCRGVGLFRGAGCVLKNADWWNTLAVFHTSVHLPFLSQAAKLFISFQRALYGFIYNLVKHEEPQNNLSVLHPGVLCRTNDEAGLPGITVTRKSIHPLECFIL